MRVWYECVCVDLSYMVCVISWNYVKIVKKFHDFEDTIFI